MNEILITGGLGYLGARLAKHLSSKKINKVSLSTRQNNHQKFKLNNCTLVKANLLDPTEVSELCKNKKTVIHAAGMNHHECEKHSQDAFNFNVEVTKSLLQKSILLGVKKFIFLSTVHVYGSKQNKTIDEESLTNPESYYAKLKVEAENIIIDLAKNSNIECHILRISNVVGPPVFLQTNCWSLLCNDLAMQATNEKNTLVIKNPSGKRDFLCMRDFCKIIEKLESEKYNKSTQIINLVSGKFLSVLEVAKIIADKVKMLEKRELKIKIKNKIHDEDLIVYSNQKARNLGLKFDNNLEHEITDLINFIKKGKFC